MKKLIYILASFSLFWTACTSPVNPSAGNRTSTLQISVEDGSRTILPTYAHLVESYEVVVSASNGNTLASGTFILGQSILFAEVPLGTHEVDIWAKNGSGQNILHGSSSVVVESSGGYAQVNLSGLLEGDGSLDLTLSISPDAGVEAVQYSLVPYQDEINLQQGSIEGNTVSITRDPLEAGYYEFYYKVLDGDGEVLFQDFEIVWIYGNIATREEIIVPLGDYNTLPEGPSYILGAYENGSVSLQWDDNSNNESAFLLEISQGNGPFSEFLLDSNTTTYTDNQTTPNTTKTYRVRARNALGDSAAVSTTVSIPEDNPGQVATPEISPQGGSITTSRTISISTSTPEATIYYTIDGSTPSSQSNVYSGPFALAEGAGQVVRAVAIKSPLLASSFAQATFDVQGGFTDGIKVYVKNYTQIYYWATMPADAVPSVTWETSPNMVDEGDGVYSYTLPGATATNLIFRTPGQSTDLSRTTGEWWYDGGTWYDYNIFGPAVPEVSFSPDGGIFDSSSVSVTLSSTNSGDVIYYTTDGTTPDSSDTVYSTPLSLSGLTTLNAIAVNVDGVWGEVNSAQFNANINNDIVPPTIESSLPGGSFADPVTVTISLSDNRPGVNGFYTLDGSTPTTASPAISNPQSFNITTRTYINVLAVDGQGNETIRRFFYNIGVPERGDFREETIYFLLPTRFYDGDPSNNVHSWDDVSYFNHSPGEMSWEGDIKGLIEKLDYIKALGFSAVWITPPVKNASGYDYHGYHAVNMKKIDPRLSSSDWATPEAAYQQLIDEVHARDMKIIQDIVLNHTGNFGEENLLPLFEKGPDGSYLNMDDPTQMIANDYLNSVAMAFFGKPYAELIPPQQYASRINALKEDAHDVNHIYHHEKTVSWNSYTIQTGQIAGDCVDLNTENPIVQEYLIDAFNGYIDMGVDAFRVDTVKHINRLMFNKVYTPAFKERGGENFFIFGENAARYWGRWSEGVPAISPSFYSWAEDDPQWVNWQNSDSDWEANEEATASHFEHYKNNFTPPVSGTPNHQLQGNSYHTPDWSLRSHLDQIDFPMHWAFRTAGPAFDVALQFDNDYNDATWNVTYVDSHDYAPDNNPEYVRYDQPDENLAENFTLMWTFRGIPTIYYGSEVRFQRGVTIDGGANRVPIESTGRAYFGDHLEGSVQTSDFGVYTNATGAMADTLSHDMARHLIRLNRIRRAVPALQKGQYSTQDISGFAFKRRYTNLSEGVDSFVLVAISGDATFNNIPNGTYVDAITGQSINVTNGSLSTSFSGQGNARIFVLDTVETPAPGQIGSPGIWLK